MAGWTVRLRPVSSLSRFIIVPTSSWLRIGFHSTVGQIRFEPANWAIANEERRNPPQADGPPGLSMLLKIITGFIMQISGIRMITFSRVLWILVSVFCISGCTQPLYFRQFLVSPEAEYGRSGQGPAYYDCGAFAMWPVCEVGFESLVPISDSAFSVEFYILPTDTSANGNDRFVEGFRADSVKIVEANTKDTLSSLILLSDTLRSWDSFNQWTFRFGEVVIPQHVTSITLVGYLQYIDSDLKRQWQTVAFPMYRHDGKMKVVSHWFAGD